MLLKWGGGVVYIPDVTLPGAKETVLIVEGVVPEAVGAGLVAAEIHC